MRTCPCALARRSRGSAHASSRLCTLTAVTLLVACSDPRPDVSHSRSSTLGPQASEPPEPGCAEASSVVDFDTFVDRYAAAALSHQTRGLTRRWLVDSFAYTRSRIVAGSIVFDASRADACIRGVREQALGPAWRELIRSRCPAPHDSPCGTSDDCDPDLFCDVPPEASYCQRLGRCRARARVGDACELERSNCARPAPGFQRTECAALGDGGTFICVNVRETVTAVGEPCAERPTTNPTRENPVMDIRSCPNGTACTAGTCAPPDPGASRDEPCVWDSSCFVGLYCNRATLRCGQLADLTCDDEHRCPRGEGLACGGGRCVATGGLRGDVCDPGDSPSDCAVGFGCGGDHRCGDLLVDGSECAGLTNIYGNDCASGCCAESGRMYTCVPPAP